MLVVVDAPYFFAAIVLEDDIVVEAAPILRWTLGKHRTFLSNYFARKGWKATVLTEADDQIDNDANQRQDGGKGG